MGKKLKIAIVLLIIPAIFILAKINFSVPRDKIGIVFIEGVIADYIPIIKQIGKAKKDPYIKAVVIVVDSPGGSVGASQEIYRAIEKLKEKKPVVVSMGNVAASGGFYVSLPANVIYANPGTITGSIGVIIQHVNANELLTKIGIKMENIKSGKNKDILYPNNNLTPEQKKLLERTILDVYNQFLNDIVKNRPIKMEKLRKIADGRVFTGKQAKELGLVDKLGNVQDAIEEAKKLANIKGEVEIVELKEKKSFLGELLENNLGIKIKNLIPKANSGIYYLMAFWVVS